MNPDTLQTVVFVTFLIQVAILIAFFVLVNDVRAIKKKFGADRLSQKTALLKALEKAKFMNKKDEIVSIYKELAFFEVNTPSEPSKKYQLFDLEEFAEEIKNHGGEIPSGLSEKISELQSKVNKK
ncbi:hypothetical protein BY457_11493 [Marinilabilia salmonicolor]|jgi:hypothetical protein|uniref:hypothetical protein n=1 Tax=Marinilabilia salmonicolor TaxID=989 RepID=UPI000D06913A|nr:hypothetical protein [Marinilabilia salmonicolor]PRY96709.1 hypothetical protein BY457_11493 [Marinilabilia salmonicolor]